MRALPSGWSPRGIALAALALMLLLAAAPAGAVTYPALTGRVVDQANIISATARGALEAKSAELESKSGIQLVVATVRSLEGQEIEPYANGLFRTWQLGEKNSNNGVLLLVAPNERRVRIEVGYGLEGTLTDALSKVIITNAITPRFKAGDFSDGITRGVDDIITALTTDASEWEKRPALRIDNNPPDVPLNGWIFVLVAFVIIGGMIISPTFRWIVFSILASSGGGGSSSRGGWSSGGGGFSGGGFSGGGGSSGGGGASGSW
jgi:uncharacterized protein